MGRKLILYIILLSALLILAGRAHARDPGFYVGGGYQQPFMFTWKDQRHSPGKKISFWPGFGAFLEVGYLLPNPDWLGIALPINYSMLRLNKKEWVHLFNVEAEATYHFLSPQSRFDPYAGVVAGFNYLSEGSFDDASRSVGPSFGIVLGLNYTLVKWEAEGGKSSSLALHARLPVKVILFVDDQDLATSGTTPILSFPFHVGVIYVF